MRNVLWLVGEPGVGKTTVARILVGAPRELVPSPKWTLSPGTYAAGWYDGRAFDGADTIPYSGARAAMDWWAAAPPRALTILDGDRLSHAGAVSFFAEQPGARLVCCYLTAPIAVGASRRAARGSNQNAAWVKGRATKACRFYANFPGHKLELPAAGDPHDLAIAVLRAVFER